MTKGASGRTSDYSYAQVVIFGVDQRGWLCHDPNIPRHGDLQHLLDVPDGIFSVFLLIWGASFLGFAVNEKTNTLKYWLILYIIWFSP